MPSLAVCSLLLITILPMAARSQPDTAASRRDTTGFAFSIGGGVLFGFGSTVEKSPHRSQRNDLPPPCDCRFTGGNGFGQTVGLAITIVQGPSWGLRPRLEYMAIEQQFATRDRAATISTGDPPTQATVNVRESLRITTEWISAEVGYLQTGPGGFYAAAGPVFAYGISTIYDYKFTADTAIAPYDADDLDPAWQQWSTETQSAMRVSLRINLGWSFELAPSIRFQPELTWDIPLPEEPRFNGHAIRGTLGFTFGAWPVYTP